MEKIFYKPIEDRKEFIFCGDTLKQCEHNETTGLWLYERYSPKGRLVGFEIVKGINHKNPDGTIVKTYPSTEMFGHYAWAYPSRTDRQSLVEALAIEDKDERRKRIRYNF